MTLPARARRALSLTVWLMGGAWALWIVANATYVTDLSAFLPARPTAAQRLLVDQLRDGPASRLILVALEGGTPAVRVAVCATMARRLRAEAAFSSIHNGESQSTELDRDFLFEHRYLMSDAITPQHFEPAGLRAAVQETVLDLSSSAGLLMKSLVPRDPTGEMMRIIEQLSRTSGPRTTDGVWASADGARTLLVAQTAAPGSDTDAQEGAVAVINRVFSAALGLQPAGAGADAPVRIKMSGPGVFAVAARTHIKHAAMTLSVASSILVIGVLLAAYRSVLALVLGLLPVATGAVVGIAAVALCFGGVHGVTLGFGITLIGESVDYSIYFFIQSLRRGTPALWPTIRLGVLTSVCGFLSLLPSGFPGLAQLGVYSISGLLAAACVTRFVLPEILPPTFHVQDVSALGQRLARGRDAWHRRGGRGLVIGTVLIAAVALTVLGRHHATLWNHELSALSPVEPDDLRYDALLRRDLGASDVLDIVVVEGSDQQTALRGAELAEAALRPLQEARLVGAVDSPARYLPSLTTQQARRAALPDAESLRQRLKSALIGLDLDEGALQPFLSDVEIARHGPLLQPSDLQGTSLASGFDALMLNRSGRWSALLPLRTAGAADRVDTSRIEAAFAAAGIPEAHVLNLKVETDALYDAYLRQAIRWSLCGFLLIVCLLLVALRSPMRVARVLSPLVLAVLSVAAALAAADQQLNILHLVGMLLIVAVGSNYALFFDAEAHGHSDGSPRILASLIIANLCTVIGFGLLSFSQVPVLVALGLTVAPGAFLALVYAAALMPAARVGDA